MHVVPIRYVSKNADSITDNYKDTGDVGEYCILEFQGKFETDANLGLNNAQIGTLVVNSDDKSAELVMENQVLTKGKKMIMTDISHNSLCIVDRVEVKGSNIGSVMVQESDSNYFLQVRGIVKYKIQFINQPETIV